MNVLSHKNIVLKGKIFDLSSPLVMAIVNATDNSFFSGSRTLSDDRLKQRIEKAISEGTDILDIGGCSTRPGAEAVPEEEEIERITRAFSIVRSVAGDFPTSVDTFRGSVARVAVNSFDCDIINDISAFALDTDLLSAVVELQKPYILTHSAGIAGADDLTNADKTPEDKFLSDTLQFFAAKIETLRAAGFNNNIIIDPGFGFAKNLQQNYSLLRNLSILECFGEPILAGLSRKSMIFRPLGISPDEALNGTSTLNMLALNNGADILRVHDVKEAVEIRTLHKLYNSSFVSVRNI